MENIINMKKVDLKKWEDMYAHFDAGHDMRHIESVRNVAVDLARKYCPDKVELVYVAATLHDIGLLHGRENHEANGAKMIAEDEDMKRAYSAGELAEIVEAIREHRASTGKPEGVVAKVVSDADKTCNSTQDQFIRGYKYGLAKFPELDHQGQIERAAKHLSNKFGEGGTGTRLYFKESEERLREMIDPIIAAVKKEDWEFFEKMLEQAETTKLTVHLNKVDELDGALEASIRVFKPSSAEVEKYHNKNDWLEKIKNNGLLVSVKDKDSVVGFAICYPKDGKFHVWNVGVLEDYRRSGIWRRMYEAILKFAAEKGFKEITLNTYKNKFPNMYSFCLSQGFVEFKTEGDKSFFIKNISNVHRI